MSATLERGNTKQCWNIRFRLYNFETFIHIINRPQACRVPLVRALLIKARYISRETLLDIQSSLALEWEEDSASSTIRFNRSIVSGVRSNSCSSSNTLRFFSQVSAVNSLSSANAYMNEGGLSIRYVPYFHIERLRASLVVCRGANCFSTS